MAAVGMMRVGVLLVGLVWVSLGLAGCHGLDDTEPATSGTDSDAATGTDDGAAEADPTTTVSPTPSATATATATTEPDPADPELQLAFAAAPATLGPEETVDLKVEASGDSVSTDVAEVVYDTVSSANTDPDELDPAAFAGRLASTTDAPSLPGTFTVETWDPDAGTTFYLRAHVVVDDVHFWSAEHTLVVDPVVHTVEIGTVTSGALANFAPATITIKPGEGVQWTNRDSTPHNADGDGGINTKNLAEDETSMVFLFDTAGTYEYVCGLHPSTMSGTVQVEA